MRTAIVKITSRCNQRCVFCLEAPVEGAAAAPPRRSATEVRQLLSQHAGAEEVGFVGGEPTLDPHQAAYARQCRALGIRFVRVETNGRRLAYQPFAQQLVEAGVTRFVVSIHGHTAALHERITRERGSFDQTVGGLKNVVALRHLGARVEASVVLTQWHLGALAEINGYLSGLGVERVVFRALRPEGRAAEAFARLAPRHAAVTAEFRALIAGLREPEPSCVLVDFPPCVTVGISAAYLGADPRRSAGTPGAAMAGRVASPFHVKRAECVWCGREGQCGGTPAAYVARHGGDELVPVPSGGHDGPRVTPQRGPRKARASARRR